MGEDGAHIHLAKGNEDLLAVALLTAWKLRVAKAGRKSLLNSSEPACRPRAPGGSGFPAVPVGWQKNERQREHSPPFCFAAILLPGRPSDLGLLVRLLGKDHRQRCDDYEGNHVQRYGPGLVVCPGQQRGRYGQRHAAGEN